MKFKQNIFLQMVKSFRKLVNTIFIYKWFYIVIIFYFFFIFFGTGLKKLSTFI